VASDPAHEVAGPLTTFYDAHSHTAAEQLTSLA